MFEDAKQYRKIQCDKCTEYPECEVLDIWLKLWNENLKMKQYISDGCDLAKCCHKFKPKNNNTQTINSELSTKINLKIMNHEERLKYLSGLLSKGTDFMLKRLSVLNNEVLKLKNWDELRSSSESDEQSFIMLKLGEMGCTTITETEKFRECQNHIKKIINN